MKWLLLLSIVFAVVILAILRRKYLERKPPLPQPVWETRTPISFEEFYDRYYVDSGLPDATVFKLLEFIALSCGIEYRKLRPEDELDTFPKGSLKKHVLEFAEILVKASSRADTPEARYWFDPQVNTVDDFIRKLGPLAAKVEEQQRQLHHG